MYTKHECTKSKGRESNESETTLELPYLLVPSSEYKN